MSTGRTIPRAIVDCIAHAREPGVRELCAVAEHIRSDLRDEFAGGVERAGISDGAMKQLSFRAAHAALTGGI